MTTRSEAIEKAARALLGRGAGFMPEPLPDGSRPWPWHALPEIGALSAALALPPSPATADARERALVQAALGAAFGESFGLDDHGYPLDEDALREHKIDCVLRIVDRLHPRAPHRPARRWPRRAWPCDAWRR